MSESRRTIRILLWTLAGLLAVPLALSALAVFHGSLEMFPTAEQYAKARIAASVSFLFFAAIETAVLTTLFLTKR